MKKLIIIALVAIAFASCEKDETKSFKINATDKISIKPSTSVAKYPMQKVSSVYTHLSALDIVKQTTEISFVYGTTNLVAARSFASEQRDITSETPKLLMWATDVISLDGKLQNDFESNFLQARDVVLVHYDNSNVNLRDTIAYVKNSTLRDAEALIVSAYNDKNIDACYSAFNTAYTFIPVTGAEWRALKAQGLQ